MLISAIVSFNSHTPEVIAEKVNVIFRILTLSMKRIILFSILRKPYASVVNMWLVGARCIHLTNIMLRYDERKWSIPQMYKWPFTLTQIWMDRLQFTCSFHLTLRFIFTYMIKWHIYAIGNFEWIKTTSSDSIHCDLAQTQNRAKTLNCKDYVKERSHGAIRVTWDYWSIAVHLYGSSMKYQRPTMIITQGKCGYFKI